MSLRAVLTSDEFDELDEGVRELYEEKDEIHILMIDGIDDHPTIKGLRNGHQNSKRERDEAKGKLRSLERRFGAISKLDGDVNFDGLDEDALGNVIKFAKGEIVLIEPDPEDPEGKNVKIEPVDLEKVKDLARKPLLREIEERTVERDGYKSKLESTIIQQALSDALIAAKIMPVYMEPLKAMFSKSIKLVDGDSDLPEAMIVGEFGEQPIVAYIKEWAQTDDGKAFVDAGGNSGGGNNGGSNRGNNGGGPKLKNPWDKKGGHWHVTQQMELYKEDPEKARRMAVEHGVVLD